MAYRGSISCSHSTDAATSLGRLIFYLPRVADSTANEVDTWKYEIRRQQTLAETRSSTRKKSNRKETSGTTTVQGGLCLHLYSTISLHTKFDPKHGRFNARGLSGRSNRRRNTEPPRASSTSAAYVFIQSRSHTPKHELSYTR